MHSGNYKQRAVTTIIVDYTFMFLCTALLLLDWEIGAFIGGRKVNGIWRWHGRLTEPLAYTWWGNNQPSGGGQDCMGASSVVQYKFNDLFCGNKKYFFCEKASNF